MPKLHQILAVEKDTNQEYESTNSLVSSLFNNSGGFYGLTERITAINEDDQHLYDGTEARKEVRDTVTDSLQILETAFANMVNVKAAKELGNRLAAADVIIEGVVIMQSVPSTTLISLEKMLVTLKSTLKDIPVVDMSMEWFDTDSDLMKTNETMQLKTRRVEERVQIAPPTKEHPEQATLRQKDIAVAHSWKTTWTGAWLPNRKSEVLERIELLIRAVRSAKSLANEQEVEHQRYGTQIINYLRG